MYSMQTIDSLDLPELAPYRTMRFQHHHWLERIFVAEGEKSVRRLLETDLGIISMLLPVKWFEVLEPLLRAKPETIRVYTAEKALLEDLTGFSMYQGLLAVARIPPSLTIAQALERCPKPRLLVAVDGLTNAENLGGLVRNAAAFNTQAIVVGETCASPYLRRAVRGSMGAIFRLPVVDATDLAAAMSELRASGVYCLAAHPHTNNRTINQANFAGDCCIVFGSEGHGISPSVLAACDEAAAVPMPAEVDSLNVGSAAAVFLYEVNRQRGRV